MQTTPLLLVLALLAVEPAAGSDALIPSDGNPRTAYFSVGDNQDLLWMPLDSKLSVETAFDALQDRYRAQRVWWRGGQVEWCGKEFVFRPENRHFDQVWRWWKYLDYEGVGVNRLAVQAAHERGMQIWSTLNLFDGGSQPDVGYSGFPYIGENRLRVEHPEYVPVNRWGTWRQGGPVEFAYPEARRVIADQLVRHTVEGGYDGLALMTYAENYSQRYDDEFGFNEPIVAEFQRRYGIDIRRQPFDKQAWSNLRGEYLTQFLRELHGPMSKRGKKLAICVDGRDPSLPTLWSAHGGVRTAGLISMDVATWAKEGLVDEVCVWAARDDAMQRCIELCRGTKTVASSLRTRGTLPAGVPRVMFLGNDVESGFDWEHYINQRDERVELGPSDTLASPDRYARRRVLTAVLKKKATASLDQLKAASSDRDLYVRRMALRALADTKNASAVPVAIDALQDVEHSVRLQAAATLGELAGAQSLPKLLEVIAHEPQSYQLRFRVLTDVLRNLQAQGRLSATEKVPLIDLLRDSNATLREIALYALQLTGAPATAEAEAALKTIVASDKSPYAREMAIVNLRSTFGPKPAVLEALRAATHDRDDAVAVHALAAVAMLAKQPSASPELRSQGLTAAVDFFRLYGDGCSRSDKDWGWRLAGEAVLGFGEQGMQAMTSLMKDTRNRRLAELAWRVVYLPQGDSYHRITLEEDLAAHAHHPFLKHEP